MWVFVHQVLCPAHGVLSKGKKLWAGMCPGDPLDDTGPPYPGLNCVQGAVRGGGFVRRGAVQRGSHADSEMRGNDRWGLWIIIQLVPELVDTMSPAASCSKYHGSGERIVAVPLAELGPDAIGYLLREKQGAQLPWGWRMVDA